MKKQQGVAAIILVLVLIPLFGSVFFALEGTRYIQKKTRLADAAEAAALAVTNQNPEKLTIAENNKESQSLTPLENNNNLASAYINSYVRNIDKDNIIITPELIINKNQNSDAKYYYQYKVNVTTTHNSWFFNELIPSFNKTQNITATALARNYPKLTGDQPIDLVFVADFSGSMKDPAISSYEDKKKCIKWKTYTIIQHYPIKNDSCRIIDYVKNSHYNDWDIKYKCTNYNTCLKYKNRHIPVYDSKINILKRSITDISSIILENPDSKTEPEKLNRITFTAFNSYTYEKLDDKYNEITNITGHWRGHKYIYDLKSNVYNLFTKQPEIRRKNIDNSFYNIPITNDKKTLLNSIESMSPNGATSAYEGIMRGAQLLNYGNKIEEYNNRKKILILLSDGQESDQFITNIYGEIIGEGEYKLKHLVVDYKLCEKIRKKFSTDNNKMFMGMVGIGYRASNNDVFHQCFDGIYETEHHLITDSNIIDVDDLSTLTDKIKELIRKGQQTDGISKLSDGQN